MTQVRYGNNDLSLMTKRREEENWTQVDLLSFGEISDIKITNLYGANKDRYRSPPKGREKATVGARDKDINNLNIEEELNNQKRAREKDLPPGKLNSNKRKSPSLMMVPFLIPSNHIT